jgi:HD-GYP domain-containing protein (c-di-GMP phosphodiesterase class II)
MTAGGYWDKVGMLGSTVARRMFLTFVGCALLPVTALALLAFVDVRDHLDELSGKRLHEVSKSTGMTVVERVSFLESDLHLIAVNLKAASARSPAPANRDFGDRIASRFLSLTVVARDGRVVSALVGPPVTLPELSSARRAHMASGQMIVVTAPRGGRVAVVAATLVDPARPDGEILAGEVDPEYLWAGDGFTTPGIEQCILDEQDRVLFSSMAGAAPLKQLRAAIASKGSTGRFEWQRGSDDYVAAFWTIFMRPKYSAEWTVVQSEPLGQVQKPIREFGGPFSLVVLSTFLVVTFFSLRQIRRSTVPIEQLLEATRRLRADDFSSRVQITSRDEFAALGDAFNDMTESIGRHLRIMNTINRVGLLLSAEKDESRLLETVVFGAQEVFNADAAGLFVVSQDEPRLALAHVQSLSLRYPAGTAAPGVASPFDGPLVMPTIRHARERTIASVDVYADAAEDFSVLFEFDRRVGYRSRSFLSVPLRNDENEVIGIVVLINPSTKVSGRPVAFSEEDRRLMESLASQAAVAITKNRLVQDFKGLFEGLTDLVSTAIDEQSPHTGGHVRRVVVLSAMIADAMAHSDDPNIRDRALSEEERYELRIAALLHDCGKLTTPVHLTDKATKLQAIVDRMRLIEARAETARRQFRVRLLEDQVRRLAAGGDDGLAAIDCASDAFDRQLQQDLGTLRACNLGHEDMPDELWQRACEIAGRYTWLDMLGDQASLVSPDEMYHLETKKGTLTREEREIIQGHVLSTMRMLEQLPYPKRLRNVPTYAGTHHERMSGDGYPFRLAGDEIPIQGRIIAIADVLEALTARDRPYRHAMTLHEAMEVLGRLAESGSIDQSLYRLVVAEHIHERYARDYLHGVAS